MVLDSNFGIPGSQRLSDIQTFFISACFVFFLPTAKSTDDIDATGWSLYMWAMRVMPALVST